MKDFGSWSTSWTSPWYGWMGRLGILELGWRVPEQGLSFLGSRRSLWEPLTLPCPLQVGFVNSLKFSAAGDFLVAGIGQEHRYCPPSLVLPGAAASPSSGSCWRVTLHLSHPQAWTMVENERSQKQYLHHPPEAEDETL